MKKIILLLLSIITLSVFIGCKNKPQKKVLTQPTTILESNAAKDSTVFGTMVDGGMHALILLTDKGDTVEYLVHPDDTMEIVKGGQINGDRFAVISYTEYGERFMRNAINITSLLGTWTSLDRTFEIKDGGTIEAKVQTETNPWISWKIFNGKLVLSKDTFDVIQLGSDSLSLENENGIFVYKRGK